MTRILVKTGNFIMATEDVREGQRNKATKQQRKRGFAWKGEQGQIGKRA